ncbi:MAG TPA: hypothetical protein VIJ11_12970 [Galbitalea sp.]
MPLAVGAPLLLLLFAASAFPWLLVLRARFGHLLAVPATAGGALVLFLATLSVSHLLDANYIAALAVSSVAVGALGAVLAARTPQAFRRPGRYAIALWCAPLLGAVAWIGTVLAAQVVPGMSRFGWAMNGDALNNLYFASLVARENGIALNTANPVPLPAAIIAAGLGAGVPASASASDALAHQLEALTLVWVLLLAAFCVAIGVVAAALIPRTMTRTVAMIGALASLLPLTWFVAGLTIQWGYFNVDVVVPIALGAWLIYLWSDRHPVAALVFLIGFALLAFAAWTPIAILVVVLGVVLFVRRFREFRAIPLRYVIPVLVACALGLIIVFRLVDFPVALATNGSLSASGNGYAGFVNLWWSVPILVVLVAASALLVRGRTTLPTGSAAIAILVGGALTTALLVYLASGGSADFFAGYYPKKFAWILLVLFGAIALSFVAGAFAGRVRPSLIAILVVLAIFGAAILPQGTWPEVLQRQPIVRIAGDYVRHDGEATVREILKLTSATHSTVLWQSGDPDEPIVNEWLLLSHGGLAAGNAKLIFAVGTPYFFYRLSGRYVDRDITKLCKVLPLLHGKPVVVTANASLQAELRATCPGTPVTVRVTTTLIGTEPSETGENWQSDGIEGPFD